MSDATTRCQTSGTDVRILITNDDGIDSAGIHALVGSMRDAGHDIVVAAPSTDMSGSSAAIGQLERDEHIRAKRVALPGLPTTEAYAVDGPPGLAVLAAVLGAFGTVPEIVVSGINSGLNTGHLVLHSGTVGAALTAQNFGLSGLAISLERAPVWPWESAGAVAVDVLEWLERLPPRSVINLNVPSLHPEAVRGIRWATLDAFGLVQTASAESADEGFQFTFEARIPEPDPRSDTALVRDGYASVTALTGVSEAEAPTIEPPRVTVRPIEGAPHIPVEAEGSATDLTLSEVETDEV